MSPFWIVFFGLIILSTYSFPTAFADHIPNSMISLEECSQKMGRDCNCWELGTCSFTSDPLGTMLIPFDSVFGGLALVIFWALIVGLLWLRTESPQLVGIVGIAMTSSYMWYLENNDVMSTPEFEMARVIGITLMLVSIGIAFYHIISNRLIAGPQ
jgi:hypothetical protein